MKKAVLVCVSLLTASSVFATTAWAEHDSRKRKPSFFESLFGISPKKKREKKRPWWEEDDVRIINGYDKPKKAAKKKAAPAQKKIAAVEVDPEVATGFGMGNLTYAMPTLVRMVEPSFAKLRAEGVANESIRLALADRDTDIRTLDPIRKAVLAYYKETGFKPVWMADGKLSPRGQQLLSYLSAAQSEGLNPNRYLPSVLTDFANPDVQVSGSALAQAQLDIGLTVAAVTYAQHVSGGAFEPERLSQYHDIASQRVEAPVAVKVLAYTPFPVDYLKGLAPKHEAYKALKAELARLDGTTSVITTPLFPAGPLVKVGQSDPRIILLRAFLADEGLIAPVDVTEANRTKLERLDKTLSNALRAFQKSRGIKVTGVLGDQTVAALNGAPPADSRDLIVINMERLRWLPKDLGRRHVFVNQAAQQLTLLEDGKPLWTTNVVVGKPMTQTNVFSDTFDDIVVNPTWTMPQGIFLRDYLGKLRSNASYVDKKGYKVYDKNGKVIRSSAINWNGVGAASPYRITQPAGASNALGTLKFNFPNRHAIYLHDTPQKELFTEQVRTFSNGCVRVENPAELAQILLGLDADKLGAMIKKGATKPIKVSTPTKVHLYYFTAWPGSDGKIAYFRDSYERDKTLINALKTTEDVFSGKRKQQLVENQNL